MYGCGIHDNLVIVGDRVFFAACKSLTPIGCLNLSTGRVVRYGKPAGQSPNFFVQGKTVLTKGENDALYEIGETKLIPQAISDAALAPTMISFDKVFQPIGIGR